MKPLLVMQNPPTRVGNISLRRQTLQHQRRFQSCGISIAPSKSPPNRESKTSADDVLPARRYIRTIDRAILDRTVNC